MPVVYGVEGAAQNTYQFQLSSDFAITQYDVLYAGQAFQPYWAARVQFVGRNPDLRTKAIFKAVGKTRRGVHHNRAGIYFAQESAGV